MPLPDNFQRISQVHKELKLVYGGAKLSFYSTTVTSPLGHEFTSGTVRCNSMVDIEWTDSRRDSAIQAEAKAQHLWMPVREFRLYREHNCRVGMRPLSFSVSAKQQLWTPLWQNHRYL